MSITTYNEGTKVQAIDDVEQTAMTFLDFHACLKSLRKTKRHQYKSWALELESHENWQVEAKLSSEQQLLLCHKVLLEIGKFLYLGSNDYDFAIYSNFCFLNNILLKSQNKVLLVLVRPLRLAVYDFAFNAILPILVNFSILPPNCIISANQGFRHFLIILEFYFLSIYMFGSCQRQKEIINKIQTFVEFFLQWILVYHLVDSRNPLWIQGLLRRN